jgi:hypothetical protein
VDISSQSDGPVESGGPCKMMLKKTTIMDTECMQVRQYLKHCLLLLLLSCKGFSQFRYLCLQFLNLWVFSKSILYTGKQSRKITIWEILKWLCFQKEVRTYNSTGKFNFHETTWLGKRSDSRKHQTLALNIRLLSCSTISIKAVSNSSPLKI